MRRKFFGIGIALVVCFLVSLLVYEIGFVSIAWAGKPQKRTYHSEYGWVTFTDDSNAIRSDGNPVYTDCTLGGEDFVKVDLYDDDGSIRSIDIVCGRMEYFHPGELVSSRRLKLCFDVQGTKIPENYVGNEAVYDILKAWKDTQGNYWDRSVTPGHLDDGSVHAEIYLDANDSIIVFVVDPGSDATDPKAITDKTVNQFYSWDAEKLNYKDTKEYGESGQIFYKMPYYGGFNVVKDSNPRTWTITPKPGTVKLYVLKYTGPRSSGASSVIYLATYDTVPSFELKVSLPDPPRMSPIKHNTLSSVWGRMKSES